MGGEWSGLRRGGFFVGETVAKRLGWSKGRSERREND